MAAFFVFALLSAARAQAPVQTSSPGDSTAAGQRLLFCSRVRRCGRCAGAVRPREPLFSRRRRSSRLRSGAPLVYKSANQGFAPAQNQLGYMYQHKFGVPRDYKRAVAYYRSAAKQGYALGQYNVGGMFEDGVGVKRDYKQAFDWYRKAADQNLPQAEKQVGYFYQCGYGVKQDLCSSACLVSPRGGTRQLRRRKPVRLLR